MITILEAVIIAVVTIFIYTLVLTIKQTYEENKKG